jgi:hypothetical protein
LAFNKGETVESIQNVKMGNGMFAVINNSHALPVFRVPSERRVNRAKVMGNFTMDNRFIFPCYCFFN